LTIVGPEDLGLRERFGKLSNVDWAGPAPRSTVADHYRAADIFVLPTHSDGFALTQLEAAAHGLPLIVSAHCGEVVEDGVSGILVDPVDAETIEIAIRRVLEPGVLAGLSAHVQDRLADFAPDRIVDRLIEAAGEMS
jgi:glycosyltransferase involved in cell wall biosynthesis